MKVFPRSICIFAVFFVAACTHFPIGTGKKSDIALSITLEKNVVQPGEAVLVDVKLLNQGHDAVTVKNLDHASVLFARWPKGEGGKSESTRFVEPVFSESIKTGEDVKIEAGKSIQRPFLFTDLSLERGEFMLQATHVHSVRGAQLKTFSASIPLTVAGEKPLVHRYSDGLLSKSDAIRISATEAGMASAAGDAVIILDEMGLKKWWVNLYPPTASSATSRPSVVKSYFVDPYHAVVWREAKPFTPEIKQRGIQELPKDSKAVQKLGRGRSR